LTLPLPLLPAGPVSAADLGPSSRLMLAAIVAQYSPELADAAKDELSRLAAGDLSRADAAQKMEVSANSIECRASDVDITSRSCAITYGSKSVTLSGRSAHELFATIGEVGVPGRRLRRHLHDRPFRPELHRLATRNLGPLRRWSSVHIHTRGPLKRPPAVMSFEPPGFQPAGISARTPAVA